MATQQTLIRADEQATEIAVAESPRPQRDLRAAMMTLPVADMQLMLAEYTDRRKAFRDWLRSQLVEGVHYGYPPGVKPRFAPNGNLLVWNSKKNCNDEIPPEQWTVKPSLYKAGAQFVADLLNITPEFDADLAAWEQLGKPAGTFVFRCRLWPKGVARTPETMVGEGRGVRKNGQKGGDENNAVKMAQKCAFVDAILNGYGLADLFTQDLDDSPPAEQPDPPEADDRKPVSQPRSERVTKDDCKSLWEDWQKQTGGDWQAYVEWAAKVTAIPVERVGKVEAWTKQAIAHCRTEMAKGSR